MNRNAENAAIARLRMESLMSSNIEMQLEHCEALYNDEKLENAELRTHLSEQDAKLRAIMTEGFSASAVPIIQSLEPWRTRSRSQR